MQVGASPPIAADGTLSKAEYASRIGRHPSAISHWINDGKLTAPALVGTGRSARINVAAADQQLSISLDLGQQLAQPAPLLPQAETPAAPALGIIDDDQRLMLRARRLREELDLKVAEAKAAELEGRWVDVQLASEAWAAELANVYRGIESWLLTVVPGELAALENHDARSIGAHLKQGFRELRQRIADQAAKASEPAPEAEPGEEDGTGEDGAEED